MTMKMNLPFNTHVAEYEEWFEEYPFVFRSEVEAIRQMLPKGEHLRGIEVGLGTGQFAHALGIKEGIEPAAGMREIALERGIEVFDAVAENLPYEDMKFDFVLMNCCVSYFNELHAAFKEAMRVLKKNGVLVIGFIDREQTIGRYYEVHKPESTFYKQAKFYSVDKIVFELTQAGFKHFDFCQTLFHPLDEITDFEPAKPGYGEGSFVVIQARKKGNINLV
jgi:SAM-dependent methyltransferase